MLERGHIPCPTLQCDCLKRQYMGRRLLRSRRSSQHCRAEETSTGKSNIVISVPSSVADLQSDSSPAVWSIIALQGLALVGALVGGILARKRRQELLVLNTRLRQVNAELRRRAGEGDLVCSARDEEAMLSYRKALETAMGSPAAAHPIEVYSDDKLSLAKARQRLSVLIKEGRTALYDHNGREAFSKAEEAASISAELQDTRASRAVSRLKAQALASLERWSESLVELESALSLSDQLKDHSHDADILGEMADAYADMGNYEQAAKGAAL